MPVDYTDHAAIIDASFSLLEGLKASGRIKPEWLIKAIMSVKDAVAAAMKEGDDPAETLQGVIDIMFAIGYLAAQENWPLAGGYRKVENKE